MISRQEAWAARLSRLRGGQFTQQAGDGISRVSFTELEIVVGWTQEVCSKATLS